MSSNDPDQSLIHSYLTLRKAVGWLGILLPFVLITGNWLLYQTSQILFSISQYYHSEMRDVLVGVIVGIALFLFFYRGYNNWGKINWDNVTTNLGGFFALGIAFFPTSLHGEKSWIGTIHFICAISFFVLLAIHSIFIFTKKDKHPTKQKLIRNHIYIACGIIMILCLIAILFYFIFGYAENSHSCFVFCGETIALIAFGVSWLTKGGTLYPDKGKLEGQAEADKKYI